MKTYRIVLALACACLTPVSLHSAAEKPDVKAAEDKEPVHKELRAFREGLTDAVSKGDLEGQLKYVHKNVVITWQNAEVTRGHDGLREFMSRNASSSNKVFQGYRVPPTPEELTILYGDGTGISYGTSVAQYKILGKEFELTNHWSATLVKEDGRWQIASYHVSANVLDNPLLNTAKNALYWTGGIAVLVGIVLGVIGTRLVGSRRRPTV